MALLLNATFLCGTCRAPMNFVKTDLPRQIKCSNPACAEFKKTYWEPQFDAKAV